jgi:predicted nucleotidyltransferase
MASLDLNNVVQAILSVTNPEKIILFGSRARQDYREDSDLDLMIIDSNPFGKERSRLREILKIRNALADVRMGIDILLYDKNEVEYWKDSINYIITSCLNEGKVLYERH